MTSALFKVIDKNVLTELYITHNNVGSAHLLTGMDPQVIIQWMITLCEKCFKTKQNIKSIHKT